MSDNQSDEAVAGADTIDEFCKRHKISTAFYFKLRKQGLGPREIRLGSRVVISHEAGRAWRAEREAATAAANSNLPPAA
jgi:hypothetical protein